jgi:hypothetical protein
VSTRCLWDAVEEPTTVPLGYLRGVYGDQQGYPRNVYGAPTGVSSGLYGTPTELFREVFGIPTGVPSRCLWVPSGVFLGRLWGTYLDTFGVLMGYLYFIHTVSSTQRQPTNTTWTTHEYPHTSYRYHISIQYVLYLYSIGTPISNLYAPHMSPISILKVPPYAPHRYPHGHSISILYIPNKYLICTP